MLLALACPALKALGETLQPSALPLTNAVQIRDLTTAEASRALPARLRGVVIGFPAPSPRALAIADQTAGIYITSPPDLRLDYRHGDLVEIEGVTDPGEFAPIILASSARKLGTALVPAARKVTCQQLVTGAMDCQWVELTGVVRECLPPSVRGSTIWRIIVAADGGRLPVRISIPGKPDFQEDAEVRVRALCFYQFNRNRQVLNPVLEVPTEVPLQVEEPAPSDPFAAPVRMVARLFQFVPRFSYGHRVHVRGIVTHCDPGSRVWIRDPSSGLCIQTHQKDALQPGDQIDVLGFPQYGSQSLLLEDSVYRKIAPAPPPSPIVLKQPDQAFEHENDLIAIEGKLTAVEPVLEGLALSVTASNTAFKAILRSPDVQQNHPFWQAGSRVKVAGICSVLHDDPRPLTGVWRPQSFQLLLRSPADLAVLQAPPWWTARRISMLLAILAVASLLVTAGVMFLARRRLHDQAQRRAMAEVEFSAILSERNRMAREIHDTLAQGLVATSVQLRLAKANVDHDPEPLRKHLDLALQLVQENLQEARKSIWNTRSQVLETGDLVGALNGILKQLADGSQIKTDFRVAGRPRRLAPVLENNILRVGQEAISNAVHHAQATSISVNLVFSDKQFWMAVKDNGCGFDPAKPPTSDGGFGLVGMRERAGCINGQLEFHSAPNQGTEISLRLPVSSE
jgi:signal transduction histidine kinase